MGCIAHELCHLEFDIQLSPAARIANDKRYADSPEYRTQHEREVDLAVIEKGYGPELLSLQSYHDGIYESYGQPDGLTQEETRRLIRNPKSVTHSK